MSNRTSALVSRHRQFIAGLLALGLLLPPPAALALLNIDGTRNQVFFFGSAAVAYDSNVYAQSSGDGDYIYSSSVGMEIKRRAGIISVNATATVGFEKFSQISELDSWNPSFHVELNKTTGRTTGAFTVNAYRTSRADSAVNLRTETWNFPIGLNLKYPINDNFYLAAQTNYLRRSYADNTSLLAYTDYSIGLDLFYVWTSKTDLIAGYRVRVGETSLGTSTDQSFTLGLTNQILPKINGTVRAGYQNRRLDSTGESFDQITTSIALSWNASRKFTLSGQVARDFSTTAVGGTVDTLSTSLRANYVFNRQVSADASVAYGRNRFLGGLPRQDDFFSWDVGARYAFSEHLQFGATYTYLINWSTLSPSDFERSGYSLNVSSRY